MTDHVLRRPTSLLVYPRRMAVTHVRSRKSHEYRWNESFQWNLIGYSKFNQMQVLLDPLRVRPAA